MQTILVTGAAGYIGSITSDLLLSRGYRIIAIDNLSRGYVEAIEYLQKKHGTDQLTYYQGDLTAGIAEDVLSAHPEIVACIHFAALLNVGESWKIPEVYEKNNVGGTRRLLDSLIAHQVKKIVFSSSCTVYGNAQYLPIDENHPIADPVTPYGKTKRACEILLADLAQSQALQYISLRYFNVCGASDDGAIGDSKDPSFHLVQNAVRSALGIAPFELNYAQVNTPDGSPIRDYVNVVDLADAHEKAILWLLDHQSGSEILNIGTGTGNSVHEIVTTVKQLTGKDFAVGTSSDRRQDEADKMIASNAKAEKVLGWIPTHTLSDSVKSLITWYTKYPKGWKENVERRV
ncbi:MAG: UDP-glucose 4-epimerase GalE [Candidatus Roizmanbacteria bacterium]